MKPLALIFIAGVLYAQVQPAPGWCSTAHCNNQMTDYVPRIPPGVNGKVYVKARDNSRSGVVLGLACSSNGTNVACSYNDDHNALVYYDANAKVLWTSGDLLDGNIFKSAPIIQTDGSVVIADDQHLYKFNPDGSVAWSTPTPGGQPTSLVTTPNGAIFGGTDQSPSNPCLQNNCQLTVTVDNPGSQYTTASAVLNGGDCPGAAATVVISGGQVTAINVTAQGSTCIVPPDVIVQGDGSGAVASTQLNSATPLAAYNGTTGALAGSAFLYANGTSGPFYLTTNTPCVNNGTHPNRVYVSTNLTTDQNQGALWALDIDPNNPAKPISPVWSIVFAGPSGASPLCNGDNVYFDGAGYVPGDSAGTTIFGVHDNGRSGTMLFHVSLGPSAGPVTCNFPLDPRPVGGFWHQLVGNASIFHRDAVTGALIESINVSDLLRANGAPPATYWMSGVFTTYGAPSHPYLLLSEFDKGVASYYAMVDIASRKLVWALPIYPGNSPFPSDTPEGGAAMVMDANGQPEVVVASRYNGAYFIASGPGTLALSTAGLSFGDQSVGNASAAQTITVTNSASAVLHISSVAASGDFSQTNTCGAPLPPGISCAITVTFTAARTGPRTGAITITDDAAGSPQTVVLSGTGISGLPTIGLSSKALSFSAQAAGTTSQPQIVTLTNSGTAALAIASIGASGDAVQSNSCAASLPPGASCPIDVMFAASGTGQRSGAVTITGNATNSPQTITLSGTGTATPSVAVGLSSTSLFFMAQRVGIAGTPQTVTLVNPGTEVLTLAGIAASGDATQNNTCGSTVGPGASCVITVSFSPTATGPRNGAITITDNAPDSPQIIAVSGVGIGNPVPLLNPPAAPPSQMPGAAAFTLNLQGGGFIPGAVVDWNGTPLVTIFAGSTQLSATVPASAVITAGTAWINVANPGPGGGLSNPAWLPITNPSDSLVLGRTDVPASSGPQALAAADFNADGKLDLAVANGAANTVSVMPGNGDGTFTARVDYPAGSQPVALAVGDFNNDGHPDLAVANQADDTISILLGNGDGTFALGAPNAAGNGPAAITAADLNGDGNLDLAVANQADNTVSIMLGNGDGTFGAHVDYASGPSPAGLAAGDFNRDGKLDLAVGNDFPGGTVSVLLGNGDGSLQSPAAYATGDSLALVAADFNADGQLDLAAINQDAQTLSVLLGNGDGTFQAVAIPLACGYTCELSPGPMGLAVGDWDGDGTLDLMVVNNGAGTVSLLQGNGDGTFRGPTDYLTASGPAAVAAGDFNGDGGLDVAVAASGSNTISVLLQSPELIFSSASLGFGNVTVGTSAVQAVTVTNSGSAVLKITSISAGGVFSQSNDCPPALAVGSVCTVTVTFTPTAIGPQTGSLVVAANLPGLQQILTLSGTGVAPSITLSLSQSNVCGGNAVPSNSVTLGIAAPAGGAMVGLSSSNPAVAAVPPSVTVPAGSTTSPAFSITTAGVASQTSVTITATYLGANSHATLVVYPASVTSVTLSPARVTGGLSTTANVVNLNGQAPPGGAVVNLASSNPSAASVPASVTVAAGATTSPQFTITAGFVATQAQVTITATYRSTKTAVLTVNPVGVAAVNLLPGAVVGGKVTVANTTVLNAPAPPGGALVTLSSSNADVAAVPASVTVAAGATTSANFTITTTAVASVTAVTISATYNGSTKTAGLTVNPATPTSVQLSQIRVRGGTSVTSNQVVLNGPAPPGNIRVLLSSSNPSVAAVPATVTVAAGSSVSQPFTITTTAVSTSTAVTISATYLGITKTATLTVTP